ncbi:MAG TPA: hypothetical protein VLW55_15695, partial [Burkholderiaceae bacterium]|nr:hypothetical protein [Burkholderiaceae bacterium]
LTRKKLTQAARVDHRNLPVLGNPLPALRARVRVGALQSKFSERPDANVLEKVARAGDPSRC